LLAERRLVDEDAVGTDDVIVLKAARERQEKLHVHAVAISSGNWQKQIIRARRSDSTCDGREELVYKSSKYDFSAGNQFDSLGEDSIS